MAAEPALKLHLEPQEPIEVGELTSALTALSRQYYSLVLSERLTEKTSDAKLLVSSVSQGSIDISMLPDLQDQVATGAAIVAPMIEKYELVEKLAGRIKWLLDKFSGPEITHNDPAIAGVTVKDCEDAINIANPVANHGGTQTFNIINGGFHVIVLETSASKAQTIVSNAGKTKAKLMLPEADIRQRVALRWARLGIDEAKTKGVSSPDKGIIEEIDELPKAVLFNDEMAGVKSTMISSEENPYLKVYFVDVEVVRTAEKIVAYRVIGFHGKDDI